jgi:DNA-binding NtrC family response regulator
MVANAGRRHGDTSSLPADSRDSQRKPVSVLLVDADTIRSERLQQTLKTVCALVDTAETSQQAEALCQRCSFDVVVVSLSRHGSGTLEWLQALRDRGERADVVLTAEYADVEIAISALRAGAADLLVRPFRDEQLLEAIQRCLRRRRQLRENFLSRSRNPRALSGDGLVGESAAIRQVLEVIERVAPTHSTLLLYGETGTGKELIARAIHQRSGRTGRFVAVNCGAIPSELLDRCQHLARRTVRECRQRHDLTR